MKVRLRLRSDGWHRLYRLQRFDVWIGPFPTLEDAFWLSGLAVAV